MTLSLFAAVASDPAAQLRQWWDSSVHWVDTHWLQIGIAVAAGLILWWRRRPQGMLGAPPPQGTLRHSRALVAGVAGLGLLMPFFGLTLALAATADWAVRRGNPVLARWLGLRVTA